MTQMGPQNYPPQQPQQDPRYQDPRYQDPRYQDPRYQDPLYEQPQYQQPQYQQPYQDPRHQQQQYQQPQYQQPQYQQPQHQQQQYQQQQYQQQPQAYPQAPPISHAANVSGSLQCRHCGSYPAKEATIRGHRGIIVLMQFLSQKGPFCRDCGIATFRNMSSKTLVQGWWGYGSFIITPFVLIWNLFQRLKFNDLPAPQPAPDGNSVAPMPTGKPLFLRATMAGVLVPLMIIGLIGYAIVSSNPENLVGQCIKVTSGNNDVDFVSCDQPNDGQVISVVKNESECSEEATGVVERFSRSRSGRETRLDMLCVK